MTLTDYTKNLYYKKRFAYYKKYRKRKLKNISSAYKRGKRLTFLDDFNEVSWGKRSENKKWIVGESWGLFHPDKNIYYSGPPELVTNRSYAKFTVKYNPRTFPDDHKTGNPVTIPFETSKISSPNFFRQKYGQFECRCTIPYDRGVWTAWWMYGMGWPPEIDIFELLGRGSGDDAGIQEMNLHYGKTDQPGTRASMRAWKVRIDTKKHKNAFHEFTLKWSPSKIEMFTDGIKIFQYTRKDILNKWFNSSDVNMQLLVNHGISDKYVGRNETDYHSEFLVDYVRVYENI